MSKGFWLPIELLKDKSTTMQEKLILVEINQLSMLDKGCIASNNHFAELFGIKKESVSRSISSLENKGYITTKIKDGSRNHERTITINKMLFEYKQNVISPLTNCLETKENKTINKTINIDTLFIQYKKENENASERELNIVMDFINYRKSIKDKIKTILPAEMYIKELKKLQKLGYKIDDCIEAMKISEWKTIKTEWIHKPTNNYKTSSNIVDTDEWSDGSIRCDPNEYR